MLLQVDADAGFDITSPDQQNSGTVDSGDFLDAVAVPGQPVKHDISKQSRASLRQAGDICTCDESSGAKWLVLYHGVQHVNSVVPRRDGRRFSGDGSGLSLHVMFVPLFYSHRNFTILCISTLFGIMFSVLKQKFGLLEDIFLTTFLGSSIDYIVCVAHAHSQSLVGPRGKS